MYKKHMQFWQLSKYEEQKVYEVLLRQGFEDESFDHELKTEWLSRIAQDHPNSAHIN